MSIQLVERSPKSEARSTLCKSFFDQVYANFSIEEIQKKFPAFYAETQDELSERAFTQCSTKEQERMGELMGKTSSPFTEEEKEELKQITQVATSRLVSELKSDYKI